VQPAQASCASVADLYEMAVRDENGRLRLRGRLFSRQLPRKRVDQQHLDADFHLNPSGCGTMTSVSEKS